MGWLDDMHRDAVAIAFPGFKLEPGDRVEIRGDWEDEGGYSTYSNWDASFEFSIRVWRRSGLLANEVCVQSCDYQNDDASSFWRDLMARGTKAEEAEREERAARRKS